MRRRLAAALALAAVVAAALFIVLGGGGSEGPVTPTDDALGYFSRDAPAVAVVQTDEDGPQAHAAAKLVAKIPFAAQALGPIIQELRLGGAAQQARELGPVLGKPLVVGLARPVARERDVGRSVVVALRVPSPTKAKQFLLRRPGFAARSIAHGRRIYQDRFGDGLAAAVDGRVLVAGGSRGAVAAALGMRRSNNRLRERDFNRMTAGLPRDAGIRVAADPAALIGAVPRLRPALRVKWIGALRGAAATLAARADGFRVDFALRTDPGRLDASDPPLAPGGGRPPPLIGKRGEVALGVRDPARGARLLLDLGRSLAPRRVHAAERALDRAVPDFERHFFRHLADRATAAIDPVKRSWAAQVQVHDPGDVQSSLQAVAGALPDAAAALGVRGVGVATPEPGEPFYALARRSGGTVVFGVVGGALIAADRPKRAAEVASESTHGAPGARGSLVATVDTPALALRLLAPRLSGIAQLGAPIALRALHDTTLSASGSRNGIRGWLKLTIR